MGSEYPVKGKIMVVDDDGGMRGFYGFLLETGGYDVILAPNGKVALEMFDDTFGLLITDGEMPEMNGPELIRRVRDEYPRTRILGISGGSDYRKRMKREGADSVLEKPVNPVVLAYSVKMLLSGNFTEDGSGDRQGHLF